MFSLKVNVSKLKACWQQFVRNQLGGVAVIGTFALFGIITLSGIGIEVARVTYVETILSYACDAAAVGAARYESTDVQENARKFFFANFEQGFMGLQIEPDVTISEDGNEITVSVEGTLPTFLGGIVNIDTLRVNAVASALREFGGVEVALVLDVTGSMASSGKIQALRTAANNFLDVLFEGADTRPGISVALAPYVMGINIGTEHTDWLTDPTQVNIFPPSQPWLGCVMTQGYSGPPYENHPFNDETEDPPGGDQLWDIYYAETTFPLFGANSDNAYDPVTGAVISPDPPHNVGPNRSCGPPLVPLTENSNTVRDLINSYVPIFGGGTNGAIGLVWGWRLISELWDGLWGVEIKAYDAPNNRKAIVLMTDGVNQWWDHFRPPNGPEGGDPNSYGSGADDRFKVGKVGANTRNEVRARINDKLARICESIKDRGIEMYTITFLVNDQPTRDLFLNCASKPENYFNATSGNELIEFYEEIASQLKTIRIVR